jgi:hypothetical protein
MKPLRHNTRSLALVNTLACSRSHIVSTFFYLFYPLLNLQSLYLSLCGRISREYHPLIFELGLLTRTKGDRFTGQVDVSRPVEGDVDPT